MSDNKRHTIMLVDDNMANLNMGKNMLKDFYQVYALPSGDRLFAFLEHVIPDLILLDIEMPVQSGYDVIKLLKADKRFEKVPVIFVTAKTGKMDELEGLVLGAADYVTKPFSAAILLKRIENQLLLQRQNVDINEFNNNLIKLVRDKTRQIVALQNSIIGAVADIAEYKGDVTGKYVSRTWQYMEILMDSLAEEDAYREQMLSWGGKDSLTLSAQLHDLGKLMISDSIIYKPGRLTHDEFEIVKTHTQKGVEAIEKMERKGGESAILSLAKSIAATHHEKWDGSGYPRGLAGQEIPLEGRIMAVADVYNGLTSTRPYKDPLTPDESARIIIAGAGTHFDPAIVEAFKKLTPAFAAIATQTA